MTIFISIISHQHTTEIIHGLEPHKLQNEDIKIVIIDNKPDPDIENYCRQHNLNYLANRSPKGFGENHNLAFKYCKTHLGLTKNDWFIVLNPDVLVERETIYTLANSASLHNAQLAAPNLFRDIGCNLYEASVRKFPYIWDSIISYLIKTDRTVINRKDIKMPCHVDWASGAFLIFGADLYERLGGFDESYYLYYEDVDICWRALNLEKVRVLYLPDIKAIHSGKRESHKAANKHLIWHITSALRFFWVRIKTALLGQKSLTNKNL